MELHTSTDYGGTDGPPPAHLAGASDCADLKGVRLGIFRDYFNDGTFEVVSASERALDKLVARGAELVNITIPNLLGLSLAHGLAISSEFAWSHDRDLHSGWELEPSTFIQLAIGRAINAQVRRRTRGRPHTTLASSRRP